jgi:hypothetical protein
MVEHASTELQSVLVRDIVLPNIAIFGPLVYAIEVAIAVSLILGLATRLGALLGALMAINLWLGLYNAPTEWPWTYMFLVILQLIYLIDPPGRSLGVDALVLATRGNDPASLAYSLVGCLRRPTYDEPGCSASASAARSARASADPSASPFSKSRSPRPILLVTCARQRTAAFRLRANV